MPLTQEDVRHVALLARIALDEEELEGLQGELNSILTYIEQLDELDLDHIEPTTHATSHINSMRPDVPAGSLSQDEALMNAPEARDGAFLIPRIIAPGVAAQGGDE